VEHLVFEIGLAALLMAMATWLASRLKLSVVPLLIIIGLAVGPHLPHFGLLDLRFIESKPIIDFMGRLGMLFLLF
jgi:K+:H+ antiporter subunit KhtU